MKKLTKDQKYYRKLKKDGKKDIRYTDKPEKGKFFRHVRVTRKPLSVRVKLAAYEKLEDLSKVLNLAKWEVLTRILLFKLPSYASLSDSESPCIRYDWLTPEDAEKIQYKGSTGEKQLTYYITSTAWKKLDIHKKLVGMSKARIVQSLILDYKPTSQATLDRAKKAREKDKEKRDAYKALSKGVKTENKFSKDHPKNSTKHLWINSDLIICHKKGFSTEMWDDEEWEEWDILVPIAEKMMKERIENQHLRWSGKSENSMLEAELLAEKENIEREEYGVDYWEAED